MRVVVGEDGTPIAPRDADHRQPGRGPVAHLTQARIADLLEPVAVLDLDGNAAGMTLGGLRELLVEILHARRARA